MAEDTLECANCGNANPAWAQICRSCGAPLTAAAVAAAAEAAVLTQGSLMAIGAAIGTIALAVVIGLVLGGILPPAPPVAVAPTPTPSATVEPTREPTPDPSGGSPDPSASVGPVLPGTLTFGLGLNVDTQRVTNPTDTFTPGTTFAYSVELTAPFGVTEIAAQVARFNKDGSETVVITAEENPLPVQNPDAMVDGFTVPTNALLDALGAGTYVMRVYRGTELLAQGTFILAE